MAKMFYTMDEARQALGKNEEEIKQLTREGRTYAKDPVVEIRVAVVVDALAVLRFQERDVVAAGDDRGCGQAALD